MKTLITGANGQLGWELQRAAPKGVILIPLDRCTFDVTDASAIAKLFDRVKPQAVVNAAAYTAVDRAEQEPSHAYKVNSIAPKLLAEACARSGARLVHISTDFVFGASQSQVLPGQAFVPSDSPRPMGIYAESKLDGEKAVVAAGGESLIIRTAWVYSAHGTNFVKTMLKLMRERESLRVVADQIGTPTWACGLAQTCWRSLERGLTGVHHWTDAGVASWYDFAVAIGEEAVANGLLSKTIPIAPIASSDYPTRAQRPAFSVLDKQATWARLGLTAPHWRVQLRGMLMDLKENADA